MTASTPPDFGPPWFTGVALIVAYAVWLQRFPHVRPRLMKESRSRWYGCTSSEAAARGAGRIARMFAWIPNIGLRVAARRPISLP